MFFRSERLFLRPAWPEDWQAILAGAADVGRAKNLAFTPWPCDEADARRMAAQAQDLRYPISLVVHPHNGEVIGGVGLVPHRDAAELGYWIAPRHRGQGYAGEAARAMVTYARAIGHKRLVAHHFLDNPASGRVLAGLGFRPAGAVAERPCMTRGFNVPTMAYALTLDEAGDCDDDPDGHLDPAGGMLRKAA